MKNIGNLELKWTAFDNGLDSLKNATINLKKLEDDDLNETEISILMKKVIMDLSHGMELIFKHVLLTEHWSLIFQKADEADIEKYQSGDFVSVNFDSLITRIKKVLNIEIDGKDKIKSFKDYRNKLEHYGLTLKFQEIYFLSLNVLILLTDFIRKNVKNIDAKQSSELEDVLDLILSIKDYLDKNEMIIHDNNKDRFFFYCPNCDKKCLIIDSDRKSHCLLCHSSYENSEIAANEYIENQMNINDYECIKHGEEYPLYECPECGVESLVHDNEKRNKFLCFTCEAEYDLDYLKFCERCGMPFKPNSDEDDICETCWDNIFSE